MGCKPELFIRLKKVSFFKKFSKPKMDDLLEKMNL